MEGVLAHIAWYYLLLGIDFFCVERNTLFFKQLISHLDDLKTNIEENEARNTIEFDSNIQVNKHIEF